MQERPGFAAVELTDDTRAKIDALSAKLLEQAAPQLRALDDTRRVTAADLSTRILPSR